MKISLIVSAYNEEKALESFYREISCVLDEWLCERPADSAELLFVNDGSTDRTGEILKAFSEKDPCRVRVLNFSRNFGHEAAMTAGLDHASGDILIFMDADLQHPPRLIPEIVDAFLAGNEVVTMTRTRNQSAGLVKNTASAFFYFMINLFSSVKLEPGASDFFAISRRAAEVLRHNYRERVRFLRGYVQNIGFRRTTICYEAEERVAGRSHYNLIKLTRFAIDTLLCFSDMPLRLGIYAGLLSAAAGVALIIYSLITRSGAPGGYTTIITVLCFMFAVLFVIVGIIGEYISLIFHEVRDRPVYILGDVWPEPKEPESREGDDER